MKPELSRKANQFRRKISPVRQIMSFADPAYIRSLGLVPEELISFAGGWVNHQAPEELRLAYREIVSDAGRFHKSGAYPHTLGTLEFKEAIIAFEQHLYRMTGLDVGQIAVGLGSTQVAMGLFEALLDSDDKVLLLDPSYCNYPTQLAAGIRDVKVLRFPVLDEATWEYNPDARIADFRRFVVENKPKLILLISPDNPTSQVPSDAFVQAALEAASEIGSFLVIDFAYKELVFGDAYPRYFSWGPSDNFIALRSNSKWCRGLGRRLGWVEAPAFVVEALESVQNSTILCPDMLHETAMTIYIGSAIKNGTLLPYVRTTNRMYQAAAERTVQAIKEELGFPFLHPRGGLYTCMRVGMDGGKFVRAVLRNAGVLLVPGWGFGPSVKHGVRVSFGPLVNDPERISVGFERIGEYLSQRRGVARKSAPAAV